MRALLPDVLENVDDDYLLSRYGSRQLPFIRFNFVSSVDGSAQLGGLSGALGSAADHRVFMLLRRLAQVVLVGSGTVHAEGYEGPLVSDEDRAWRLAHNLSPDPVLAIVSRSLSLSPQTPALNESPAPVLLFCAEPVSEQVRASYPSNVEIIQIGRRGDGVDPSQIVAQLVSRGLQFIHAEGGPRLFGQFAAAGVLDSLCLSYSPVLAAGQGARICSSPEETEIQLHLHTLLEEDSMLLSEYRVGQ
ncbi:dihydrofolate reductase family protein [Glutamicibacter sp.]|uniref:dihydrofolate reductase family protein n=1 Tax=Glutamicibacter sp. TaxID=1931995 RepID=UPI0028BF1A5D|nr:dihydrofolate reductase family protein [Glutamicibacter sp.]